MHYLQVFVAINGTSIREMRRVQEDGRSLLETKWSRASYECRPRFSLQIPSPILGVPLIRSESISDGVALVALR